jgi:hypothetical protein
MLVWFSLKSESQQSSAARCSPGRLWAVRLQASWLDKPENDVLPNEGYPDRPHDCPALSNRLPPLGSMNKLLTHSPLAEGQLV